jgi:hypothetical protein
MGEIMALRERVTKPQPAPGLDPAELAIINKGGAPTSEAEVTQPLVEPEKPVDEITKWTLRIPAELMALVEKDAKKAYAKKSINTWFVEAAVEKLRAAGVELEP